MPVHCIYSRSELVSVNVNVAEVETFPFDAVDLVLGKDVAVRRLFQMNLSSYSIHLNSVNWRKSIQRFSLHVMSPVKPIQCCKRGQWLISRRLRKNPVKT